MNATQTLPRRPLPAANRVRQAAAAIRRDWTPAERQLRRRLASRQQQRLLGALVRSAA
ncbi:MAG: hypothetical protein WD872_01210 [Pirellulaceae bacterium]